MPNQTQVDNTILAAQYKLAQLVNTNLNYVLNGLLPINEAAINYLRLNLQGLIYQANRPDYTSNTTVTIYNRLLGLIGINTDIPLDPNFQNPTVTIITTGIAYPEPVEITYAMMTGAGTVYTNPAWAGFNPFLFLDNTTWLQLGVDYSLLLVGGFQLLPSGSVPAIYSGQTLRAVSYATT